MNPSLNRRFHGAIAERGIDKPYACPAASGGRTEHSHELSDTEAEWFLGEGIKRIVGGSDFEDCRRKRRRLIAMAYDIGEAPGFVKAWAEKYGVGAGETRVKRPFNRYSSQELSALIAKFQKVVSDRMKAVTNR